MSDAQAHRPFSELPPLVKWLAAVIVVVYAVVSVLPLIWIGATAFKSQEDAIAYPPKVLFAPTLERYPRSLHGADAPAARLHRWRPLRAARTWALGEI